MNPKCPKCNIELHYCVSSGVWDTDHYFCCECDGTYNIFEFCVFCGLRTHTREHHIIPKSKGGTATVDSCQTCEDFLHNTWSHNELRDTYNNVETILADEKFKKFLKWRLKQPPETLFKSDKGKTRSKRKYS